MVCGIQYSGHSAECPYEDCNGLRRFIWCGDMDGLRNLFGGGRYGWSAEFNIRGIRQNARMKIAMVCGIYLVRGDMDGLRNLLGWGRY